MICTRRPSALAEPVNALRERLGEMDGAKVEDAVHRIEAKRIDVELVHPVACVLDDEAAYLVAVGAVVVHCRPPRCAVCIREVRAVLGEVVPLGADVIVDDVERHREPGRVRGVDQALEGVGASVAVLRREELHAIVAPVPRAGKLRDGHQLDDGDSEIAKLREPRDDRVEGSFGSEGPDVELVDDEVGHLESRPLAVRPRERIRIDYARRAVDAVRLRSRHGIGSLVAAVDTIRVVVAGLRARDRRGEDASLIAHERILAGREARVDAHRHLMRVRRPHREARRTSLRMRAVREPHLPFDRGQLAPDASIFSMPMSGIHTHVGRLLSS